EHRPDAHARQGARADPAALGVLGSGRAARPRLGAAGAVGAGSAGSGQVVPRGRLAMKFYEAVLSSAAFRVRIALGLKGLAYESVVFDLRANQHLTDEYRRINPMRSVPALELAPGQALFESMAIVEYLDETYPEPPLLRRVHEGRRVREGPSGPALQGLTARLGRELPVRQQPRDGVAQVLHGADPR